MLYELVDMQHDMLIMHMLWHRCDRGYISCYDACMIMECVRYLVFVWSGLLVSRWVLLSVVPSWRGVAIFRRYSVYYITRRLHGGTWENQLSIITLWFLYAHVDSCYQFLRFKQWGSWRVWYTWHDMYAIIWCMCYVISVFLGSIRILP